MSSVNYYHPGYQPLPQQGRQYPTYQVQQPPSYAPSPPCSHLPSQYLPLRSCPHSPSTSGPKAPSLSRVPSQPPAQAPPPSARGTKRAAALSIAKTSFSILQDLDNAKKGNTSSRSSRGGISHLETGQKVAKVVSEVTFLVGEVRDQIKRRPSTKKHQGQEMR
ncbi:hypothetical protein MKZ38_000249 [Zalerion maritima]|uniref:Uncharacterized protein n=1 Tax=Zalerion maritima TaxID=339359 RepID=A0AAD5WTU5_9PEZI|nr:hypothetical protein MKZ38_000249 [Zalerion maritima]